MFRGDPPIKSETLTTPEGLEVGVLSLGASLHYLRIPTGAGPRNVLLGYDNPQEYAQNPYFIGSTIGRYAGRIAHGRCSLNGATLWLATPQEQGNGTGRHTLHGGPLGFHTRHWQFLPREQDNAVALSYVSPDGEQGFPGEVDVLVRYVADGLSLRIEFTALADRDTVISLTNHAYFNLDRSPTIDDHHVQLFSDRFLQVNDELVPSGRVLDVAGTRFDLRRGSVLRDAYAGAVGFDQTYLARAGDAVASGDGHMGETMPAIAVVESGARDVRLVVSGTQPAFQFYTGHMLGPPFDARAGLCVESQQCPDAPNHPDFPSPILRAGQTCREAIVYRFETF